MLSYGCSCLQDEPLSSPIDSFPVVHQAALTERYRNPYIGQSYAKHEELVSGHADRTGLEY